MGAPTFIAGAFRIESKSSRERYVSVELEVCLKLESVRRGPLEPRDRYVCLRFASPKYSLSTEFLFFCERMTLSFEERDLIISNSRRKVPSQRRVALGEGYAPLSERPVSRRRARGLIRAPSSERPVSPSFEESRRFL
jgi:hypothetical protein